MGRKLNAVQLDKLWTDECRKFDSQRQKWWQRYGKSNEVKPYDWDFCYKHEDQHKTKDSQKPCYFPRMETETSYIKDFQDYSSALCPPTYRESFEKCKVCNARHVIALPKEKDICIYGHCL
ncbi:uncharacterized protein TNIN_286671 [Trichonephila inaurata madagascariensis]|uniref:Uncharacterized protein n=1 Tax=Trichonephila inaurata madagascariensis TaxID=2747483 RepID=A0A8X7C3F9_9ARAC|nr:uncharacterized protein TNIN_286671 [Trichonephila inaurata madagascariensis]